MQSLDFTHLKTCFPADIRDECIKAFEEARSTDPVREVWADTQQKAEWTHQRALDALDHQPE